MKAYVIAIPSYRRCDLLKEKTLAALARAGIDSKRVHVFVADAREAASYEACLDKGTYGKIVVGVKGIRAQREFICRYFPEGARIVSIDDDVADVLELSDGKAKCTPMRGLDAFFKKAFDEVASRKLYIWGVYPTPNEFYMKGQPPITTKLRFIIGTLYGFVNRKSMIARSPIEEKEDVETSIAYYLRDGGVLRYNRVCFKTKFKNEKGGLGGLEGRLRANEKAAAYLHEKYPSLTRIKVRKNGMHEIVLKAPRENI